MYEGPKASLGEFRITYHLHPATSWSYMLDILNLTPDYTAHFIAVKSGITYYHGKRGWFIESPLTISVDRIKIRQHVIPSISLISFPQHTTHS